MSRIKLKSIVSEIIKEMVDTHPIHQKINNKLMQIARRGLNQMMMKNTLVMLIKEIKF